MDWHLRFLFDPQLFAHTHTHTVMHTSVPEYTWTCTHIHACAQRTQWPSQNPGDCSCTSYTAWYLWILHLEMNKTISLMYLERDKELAIETGAIPWVNNADRYLLKMCWEAVTLGTTHLILLAWWHWVLLNLSVLQQEQIVNQTIRMKKNSGASKMAQQAKVLATQAWWPKFCLCNPYKGGKRHTYIVHMHR